jgi:hypothetical protein
MTPLTMRRHLAPPDRPRSPDESATASSELIPAPLRLLPFHTDDDTEVAFSRPNEGFPAPGGHDRGLLIAPSRRTCLNSAGCILDTAARTVSKAFSVSNIGLDLSVSSDEEHVELTVTHHDRRVAMGARAHNYLLLTLARRRIRDVQDGFPDTVCGWIYRDALAHDPDMTGPRLNIHVFRIRRQLAVLGVTDAPRIIERRVDTGQLRVGTSKLSVRRI